MDYIKLVYTRPWRYEEVGYG